MKRKGATRIDQKTKRIENYDYIMLVYFLDILEYITYSPFDYWEADFHHVEKPNQSFS